MANRGGHHRFLSMTITTHHRDRGGKWSNKKRGVRGGHGVSAKNQCKTNSIIQRSMYKLQMYILRGQYNFERQ